MSDLTLIAEDIGVMLTIRLTKDTLAPIRKLGVSYEIPYHRRCDLGREVHSTIESSLRESGLDFTLVRAVEGNIPVLALHT